MATEPMVCPDCAGPVEAGRDRLCPRCGYPLMFLETEPPPDAAPIGRRPGERDDATTVLPAVGRGSLPPATPEGPPAVGETRCASCGRHNPGRRIRCERCGHLLRRSDPAAPPVAPPPPDPPRTAPPWAVALAVAAAAVVVVALLAWLLID
jgi:DNA-directed RNA polymerase subunit RPC12/RpoP